MQYDQGVKQTLILTGLMGFQRDVQWSNGLAFEL